MQAMFDSSLVAVVARDASQSQFEGLAAFAEAAYPFRLCDLASMTWVMYDWLFTLDDEVKYIWGSANTPPKILYLVSRYLGLVIVIPPAVGLFPFYCYSRLVFTSVSYHLLTYAVEFNVMIRLYALWGQRKRVAFALVTVFMLLEAINIFLLVDVIIVLRPSIFPVPSAWSPYVNGCVILQFGTVWRFVWLPDLVLNTVIFVLSCIRYIPYRSSPDAPLFTRVFRDGAVYYVCLLLFFLIYTTGLLAGDVIPWLDGFVPAFLSIASSHLLLSIRAYVHARDQTNAATTSLALDFQKDGSTTAGSYELAACTARTGRSTVTDIGQTATLHTMVTEVLRNDADVDDGHPTLSPNARHGDLEAAEPVSAVNDDAALGHTLRSRRFNGFAEWIVAE